MPDYPGRPRWALVRLDDGDTTYCCPEIKYDEAIRRLEYSYCEGVIRWKSPTGCADGLRFAFRFSIKRGGQNV